MLRWERPTDHRYYKAWLQKDLLGDIHLMCSHGQIGTRLGNWFSIPCENIEQARRELREVFWTRKRKGYKLFPEAKDRVVTAGTGATKSVAHQLDQEQGDLFSG